MSVKTPEFKFDTPVLGEEANVPADLLSLATEIENVIKALDPKYLKEAASSAFIVCNAAGVPQYRIMSGDTTMNNEGKVSIGGEKISTATLAALCVTEAKIALEAIGTGTLKALAVTAAKLAAECVETGKIQNLAVTAAKIANETITDAKLASPNNSVYRTITREGLHNYQETSNVTKYFIHDGALVVAATVKIGEAVNMLYYSSEDYAVAGKTTKLRLRGQMFIGGTAPAQTLTISMYPVTAVAAGLFTIGAAVAGSGVAFVAPGANTNNQANSGDFTPPANGYYIFGVSTSGATAAGSLVDAAFQLQVRNV